MDPGVTIPAISSVSGRRTLFPQDNSCILAKLPVLDSLCFLHIPYHRICRFRFFPSRIMKLPAVIATLPMYYFRYHSNSIRIRCASPMPALSNTIQKNTLHRISPFGLFFIISLYKKTVQDTESTICHLAIIKLLGLITACYRHYCKIIEVDHVPAAHMPGKLSDYFTKLLSANCLSKAPFHNHIIIIFMNIKSKRFFNNKSTLTTDFFLHSPFCNASSRSKYL